MGVYKNIEDLHAMRKRLALETAGHFNLGNLAMVEEVKRDGMHTQACVYSKGCAIGRLLSPETIAKIVESKADKASVTDICRFLPPELHELGMDYLEALQCLHDDTEHWTETGLSAKGKVWLDKILRDYCGESIKPEPDPEAPEEEEWGGA